MKRATLLGLCLCLSACFTAPSEAVNVSGQYALISVNGSPLPYSFANGVTIKSEFLFLSPNGTFQDIATRSDGTTVTDEGIYSNFGTTINFGDTTQNILYQGILNGTILTTTVGSFTERWQRN